MIEVLFLSKEDVESTKLALQDVLEAIEMGLKAHSEKKVIMPSKDHLVLEYPYRPIYYPYLPKENEMR